MTTESPGAPLLSVKYRLEREDARKPFTPGEVRRLPKDVGGVYAIWLPPNECLYVGMSEDRIRARLMDHLRNETNPGLRRDLQSFPAVVRFSAVCPLAPEEIRILEAALIRDWNPRHNRVFAGEPGG